jgi:hypothetical protein
VLCKIPAYFGDGNKIRTLLILFSIPKGGVSQEKQSSAVVFPFSPADQQAAFLGMEIQESEDEGAGDQIPNLWNQEQQVWPGTQ